MKRRTIVIGDVHGCASELEELLALVQYDVDSDRLVFLGDLVDRGPDPLGVIRRVRQLGAECVKGNHDEKLVRWRKHYAAEIATGKRNPMRPPIGERFEQWMSVPANDLAWLDQLPWTIDLPDGWIAVHAGFEPHLPLVEQRGDRMCRVRYVQQETGAMIASRSEPTDGVYWTRWTGPWKAPTKVVYGHAVHSLERPRNETIWNGIQTMDFWGIDTGCCFGGRLTALIFQEGHAPQVQSVPAHRRYAELLEDEAYS